MSAGGAGDRGLDRLLDRAVVPGYTNLGYAIRRLSWDENDPALLALQGRRAMVTGAGGGLGECTALGLARFGATVHLVVRSRDRAAGAVERIRRALDHEGRTPDLVIEECDVSALSSVREFATGFTDPLDIVVHNAGLMPPERTESADGHELTLATHVLGPVLMTELLLPALRASRAGARVVFVSSGGMYAQALEPDDLEFARRDYKPASAYAHSKRVQVELLPKLAERWADARVGVYAMHPGWADTPGVASSLPVFRIVTKPLLRSTEAGADTAVWLAATEPTPPPGTFWHDREQRPINYYGTNESSPQDVEKAWQQVLSYTGLSGG